MVRRRAAVRGAERAESTHSPPMTRSTALIGETELRARQMLADAGCSWLSAYRNSKVIPAGTQPKIRIPTGNAHVVLAPDLVIIEVDDEPTGLPLFEALVDDVPTLGWRSRRGPKVVLRLPPGAQRLRHGVALLSGLEILTDRAMAPGSTVKGFYLETVALRPIATIDPDMAVELAQLAPASDVSRRRMTFVAREHAWSPGARRSRAGGRAASEQPAAAQPDRAALDRRATWLAESRPRHRYQAQYRLALQMQRFGEDFESFVELVIANPVGGNLKGKGDPRTRLSRTWENAGRESSDVTAARRRYSG